MKIKLPKSVYRPTHTKKYSVNIHSKKYNKNVHVGYFNTILESVEARDKFVVDNYNDITSGYLPRGITNDKRRNIFNASFTFEKNTIFIGSYKSLHDAIEARNNFIDSLK